MTRVRNVTSVRRMSRITRAGAGLVAAALALTLAPAATAAPPPDAPPETYLYIVDASYISVIPSESGKRAKVIVRDAKVTRFSDRPYRHQRRITVEEMLREFEWDAATKKWGDPTPNAGVSVAGQRTEIIDIKRSTGDKDRLVLHVKDVHKTLRAVHGTGAIFIDNVVAFPIVKTSPIIPTSSFVVTLTSPTSVTVNATKVGGTKGKDVTLNSPSVVAGKPVTAQATITAPLPQLDEEGRTVVLPGTYTVTAEFTMTQVTVSFGYQVNNQEADSDSKGFVTTNQVVFNF